MTTSFDERTNRREPDLLRILGIEVFAHHGVFEHERREGQTFVIDLELAVDISQAAKSDDLGDTVDYGTLVERVVAEVQRDPVDLIETLVERIAHSCLLDSRVEWARVTVHKPQAPIQATFSDVQLTVTRHRTRHRADS